MYARNQLPGSWGNYINFPLHPLSVHISCGWYPLVVEEPPALQLDQYLGPAEYDVQAEQVVKSRPVITYTLDELKELLKERGKGVAMAAFEGEFPYAQGLAVALSVFGAGPRAAMIERLQYFVQAYQTFAAEVDACETKAELLVVYNNYPQLHGVF